MKLRSVFIAFPLIAGIIFMHSCKKDEEAINKKDLLLGNVWVYDTLAITPTTDAGFLLAVAFVDMAYQGSEFDFYKDSTYEMTSDMGNHTGTWKLIENKTLLMDNGTEDEVEFEITEIDNQHADFKVHLSGELFSTPYEGDVTLMFNAK